MPFRSRKSLIMLGGWSAFEDIDDVDMDSGRAVHKHRNCHTDKLPRPEQYDLEVLLKAGVPLQQVRTKVLPSDVTGLASAITDESVAQFNEQLENLKNKQ